MLVSESPSSQRSIKDRLNDLKQNGENNWRRHVPPKDFSPSLEKKAVLKNLTVSLASNGNGESSSNSKSTYFAPNSPRPTDNIRSNHQLRPKLKVTELVLSNDAIAEIQGGEQPIGRDAFKSDVNVTTSSQSVVPSPILQPNVHVESSCPSLQVERLDRARRPRNARRAVNLQKATVSRQLEASSSGFVDVSFSVDSSVIQEITQAQVPTISLDVCQTESPHSRLAPEARAGLASVEDFSSVVLTPSDSRVDRQSERFPSPLMICVRGKRSCLSSMVVPPLVSSLCSSESFLLIPASRDVAFVWHGAESHLAKRRCTEEMANYAIDKGDLGVCKAPSSGHTPQSSRKRSITIIQEGEFNESFFRVLGGTNLTKDAYQVALNDDDYSFENVVVFECVCDESNRTAKLVKIDAMSARQPVVSDLCDTKSFVYAFDGGNEVWSWLGSQIAGNSFNRKCSWRLCEQLRDRIDPRPSLVMKSVSGHESCLFKTKFRSWRAETNIQQQQLRPVISATNSPCVASPRHQTACVAIDDLEKSLIDRLCAPVNDRSMRLTTLESGGVTFGRGHGDVIEFGASSARIVTDEIAVFRFSKDDGFRSMSTCGATVFVDDCCYVVLWKFHAAPIVHRLNGASNHASTADHGRSRTVIFYWHGARAPQSTVGELALILAKGSLSSSSGGSAVDDLPKHLMADADERFKVAQFFEPPSFLRLFRGMLFVRRSAAPSATNKKKYLWMRPNISKLVTDEAKMSALTESMFLEISNECLMPNEDVIVCESDGKIVSAQLSNEMPCLRRHLDQLGGISGKISSFEGHNGGRHFLRAFYFTQSYGKNEAVEVFSCARGADGSFRCQPCFAKLSALASSDRNILGQFLTPLFPFSYTAMVNGHYFTLEHRTIVMFCKEDGTWVIWTDVRHPALCGVSAHDFEDLSAKQIRFYCDALLAVERCFEMRKNNVDAIVDNITAGAKRELSFNAGGTRVPQDVLEECFPRCVEAYIERKGSESDEFLRLFPDGERSCDGIQSIQKQSSDSKRLLRDELMILRGFTHPETVANYCLADVRQTTFRKGSRQLVIDDSRLELYLDDDSFAETFDGMTKGMFSQLPIWKQQKMKKNVGLF